jgi:hypothetical protein
MLSNDKKQLDRQTLGTNTKCVGVLGEIITSHNGALLNHRSSSKECC